MKIKQLLSLAFVAVPLMASAQGIEINEENFPDENFRNYLLEQSYGKDDFITDAEIKGITSIYVDGKNISSLKGIEYFTALTWLWCSDNQLISLDVSNNTALDFLRCSYNQLTSLDVSNNTALTNLDCDDNQLISLDVSKNTALTNLRCCSNQLTSLDVSKNTALTSLSCDGNQLTSLDVSNNTALTGLGCSDNQLTSLDVSNNTALTDMLCYYNQLTSLDVSNNTALTGLWCNSNQLTSLDVSNNTALTSLYCYGNQLTSLDVSNNTALTDLLCSSNQLTSLDVSKNTALTSLNCSSNQLTSLDVSNNTALTYLYCYNNQIKGITMDALINSLPNNTTGWNYGFFVYYNDVNEGNICTHNQVAAIKAKGWTPYNVVSAYIWEKYEGCNAPSKDIVSVGADGLATYCPAFDMDFTNAKEIAAYKATVSGNEVLLERVGAVAAGEGVLLRSLNGGEVTEELPIIEAEKSEDNAFVGVLEAKTLQETDGNVTNFVLSNVNGEVGFFKANDTRISAWKAYLPVENYTAEMAAKGLGLVFDDATGISNVTAQPSTEDDAIYTLSGVRVANPTKGIYIKNGKKMVVK